MKGERGRKRAGKKVLKAVRVPKPLSGSKAPCDVERHEVLPYPRNPSIWNQREKTSPSHTPDVGMTLLTSNPGPAR